MEKYAMQINITASYILAYLSIKKQSELSPYWLSITH